MKKLFLSAVLMAAGMGISLAQSASLSEWKAADVNVAEGCPAWVSAINSGALANITDGNLENNCQLTVSNYGSDTDFVEWMVLDLRYEYDINKINLVLQGDRKDSKYAIYTAPAQDTEPAFAIGNMAIPDDAWTLAFYGEVEDPTLEANKGLLSYTFDVDLSNVRYIKYKGIARPFNDQWGVAFREVRVAGTTNDDSAKKPDHITIGLIPNFFAGSVGAVQFNIVNNGGLAVDYDANLLSVSTSNAEVATAQIDGNLVKINCLAVGNVTVTLNYNNKFDYKFNIDVHNPFVAAPVPTHDKENVLSFYSDSYGNAVNYYWTDWGWLKAQGSEVDINGNKAWFAPQYVYYGSQFNEHTDVSSYDYFHIDIYPTKATSIGIKFIAPVAGEKGCNTKELVPYQWNSIDISLQDFKDAGATNLENLYQIKYVQHVEPITGGSSDADGSYDVYFDNVYFWKDVVADEVAPVWVKAEVSKINDKSVELTLNATDNHEAGKLTYTVKNGEDVVATVQAIQGVDATAVVKGLTPNTDYSFTVSVEDANGNVASYDNSLTFKTLEIAAVQTATATATNGDSFEFEYKFEQSGNTVTLTVDASNADVNIDNVQIGWSTGTGGFYDAFVTSGGKVGTRTWEIDGERIKAGGIIYAEAWFAIPGDVMKSSVLSYTIEEESPVMVIPEFTVNVGENSFTKINDTTVEMTYTIEHSNYESVKHYHIWVVAVNKGNNMQRRVESVNLGETHHDNMDELTGKVTLNNLNESAITVVKVHAQAVLNDGTTVNPSNWNEGDPEGATSANSFEVNTDTGVTTGVETVNVNADAAPVYYNLQGIKVDNPKAGVYVVVKGDKVSKVIIK